MYHDRINDLIIRNNELEQRIKDTEILKNQAQEKLESVRRIILTNVGIAAFGQFVLGTLVHPAIGLASLLLLCCTVPPGGIIFMRREDKVAAYEKEIETYTTEIEKNKIELDSLYVAQQTKSNNFEPVIAPKNNVINNKRSR